MKYVEKETASTRLSRADPLTVSTRNNVAMLLLFLPSPRFVVPQKTVDQWNTIDWIKDSRSSREGGTKRAAAHIQGTD